MKGLLVVEDTNSHIGKDRGGFEKIILGYSCGARSEDATVLLKLNTV